jgi:Protein of unknown function (DUF3175)
MARRRTTRRATKRTAPGRARRRQRTAGQSWVRHVQETSNAMDLAPRIFKGSPRSIALGLKRSVLRSRRTKGTKFQSAMSMLNLYINRSGRNLGAVERRRLEAAKDELRKSFGRERPGARRAA